MNKEKYREFLETFIPSPEMREYLSGEDVWKYKGTVADIIKGAPVPLETKAKWLEDEDKLKTEEALRELHTSRPGEIFCFFEAWYDRDVFGEKMFFETPVSSYGKAIDLIRREIEESKDENGERDPDVLDWYVLEKWRVDENGDWSQTFTWYLFDEEPVFFHKEGEKDHPYRFIHLNLPVPFEPGDILTVDCRPFAPPVNALLVEKGDNGDCCCLQILYRDIMTRGWETCALKHGIRLKGVEAHYYPLLSPLYRLSRFKGELPAPDAFLDEIGKKIGGDDRKGRALWCMLNGLDVEDEETDPGIRELVSEVTYNAMLEGYVND